MHILEGLMIALKISTSHKIIRHSKTVEEAKTVDEKV